MTETLIVVAWFVVGCVLAVALADVYGERRKAKLLAEALETDNNVNYFRRIAAAMHEPPYYCNQRRRDGRRCRAEVQVEGMACHHHKEGR